MTQVGGRRLALWCGVELVGDGGTHCQAGNFSYFADKGKSPLPYAICEFVDNSLAAICQRQEPGASPGRISIHFERCGDNSILVIRDNGCGMDFSTLAEFATYALSPEARGIEPKQDSMEEFYENPLRLNAGISKFGVGAKTSAFHLGSQLYVLTKQSCSDDIREFHVSRDIVDEFKTMGKDCWEKSIRTHPSGSLAESLILKDLPSFPYIQGLVQDEERPPSFTYVIVADITEAYVSRFEEHAESVAKSLAHVYHYYLHDHPAITSSIGGSISIGLTVGRQSWELTEVDDLEAKLLREQQSTFTFELITSNPPSAVFGTIGYFPFVNEETLGAILSTDTYNDIADGGTGETPASEEPQLPALEKYPIFSCWWQGRLIPMTTVDWLPSWMQGAFVKELARCRYRLRGALFFDSRWNLTNTKGVFTEDVKSMLEGPDVVARAFEPGQRPYALVGRETRNLVVPIRDQFAEWVRSCHVEFDRELEFRCRIPYEAGEIRPSWVFYSEMAIANPGSQSRVIRTGDIIQTLATTNEPAQFYRVVKFRKRPCGEGSFEEQPERITVSDGRSGPGCIAQRLPEMRYPNHIQRVQLRSIDKAATESAIQSAYEQCLTTAKSKYPARLEVVISPPGQPPSKVKAGYVFPNTDIRVLNGGTPPAMLHHIPFTRQLLKLKQCISKFDTDKRQFKMFGDEISKSGEAKNKVFSFWEIGTPFNKVGRFRVQFKLLNCKGVDGQGVDTDVYEFEVVADKPAMLRIVDQETDSIRKKSYALPVMHLGLGCESQDKAAIVVLDRYKNKCLPDDDMMRLLSLRHGVVDVRSSRFICDADRVLITKVRLDPKDPASQQTVDVSNVTSLDVYYCDDLIGKLPVSVAGGEPFSIGWPPGVEPPSEPITLRSGTRLPPLDLQLYDRFRMPCSSSPAVKGISLHVNDSRARLNRWRMAKPLLLRASSVIATTNGAIHVPAIRVNSGQERLLMTIRLEFERDKSRLRGSGPESEDVCIELVVTPGDEIASFAVTLADVAEGDPVVVGSTHCLKVILTHENGSRVATPYPASLLASCTVEFNGERHDLTADGVISPGFQFPTTTRTGAYTLMTALDIGSAMLDSDDDDSAAPTRLTFPLKVSLVADVVDHVRISVQRALTCGVPMGNALQVILQDKYDNAVADDDLLRTLSVTFPELLATGDTERHIDGAVMTFPGRVLVGAAKAGYVVQVDGAPDCPKTAKFELVEGPPHHFIVKFPGIAPEQSFIQDVGSEEVIVDVPIYSRCKLDVTVHVCDAAGAILSSDLSTSVSCDYGKVLSSRAGSGCINTHSVLIASPSNGESVAVTIEHRASNRRDCIQPYVLRFVSIRPWLRQVCGIVLEPVQTAIRAEDPLPVIQGHLVDCRGQRIDLLSHHEILRNLWLSQLRDSTETPADDLYEVVAVGGADATVFRFCPHGRIQHVTQFELIVHYNESDESVLELLPDVNERTITRSTGVLRVVPCQPFRLIARSNGGGSSDSQAQATDSRSAIPDVISLYFADRFNNLTGDPMDESAKEQLACVVKDYGGTPLCKPRLSLSAAGDSIVIVGLRINPNANLPSGSHTLMFKLHSHPNIQPASLRFFYSPDAQEQSEHSALKAQEALLKEEIRKLQAELTRVASLYEEKNYNMLSLRDRIQVISVQHCPAGQQFDSFLMLSEARLELGAVHQKIKEMSYEMPRPPNYNVYRRVPNFAAIVGQCITCANREDARLVTHALGPGNLNGAIYTQISASASTSLRPNAHFDLSSMRSPRRTQRDPPWMKSRGPRKTWSGRDPRPLSSLVRKHPQVDDKVFEKVCGNFLQGFEVMDTYQDAMSFKQYAIRHNVWCGTLLTYDGGVVASNGRLGDRIKSFAEMLPSVVSVHPVDLLATQDRLVRRIDDIEKYMRMCDDERALFNEAQQLNDESARSVLRRLLLHATA
ncbi:hypothetical protein PBRA_006002 [Plasmodiophora brassicae]|uniref:SMCHD1 ribosomal S5 domain-containing protein n=1 Tax=Plasmodiophora brassicae TaxID=37360 RepID=A0A0G4IR73_PLABS|nr:hypothetical protein PBRA_006002 [Plasmodiophora brassicae]